MCEWQQRRLLTSEPYSWYVPWGEGKVLKVVLISSLIGRSRRATVSSTSHVMHDDVACHMASKSMSRDEVDFPPFFHLQALTT
jgi:hypothetical protein